MAPRPSPRKRNKRAPTRGIPAAYPPHTRRIPAARPPHLRPGWTDLGSGRPRGAWGLFFRGAAGELGEGVFGAAADGFDGVAAGEGDEITFRGWAAESA